MKPKYHISKQLSKRCPKVYMNLMLEIVELTEEKNSNKKKSHHSEYDNREGYKNISSNRESLSIKRGNGCERCGRSSKMT